MDNDVGGEPATSDVGEASAVLELTMQPRRMLDALPVSDVVASSVRTACDVRIGFVIENLRVNMLLHGVVESLSVGDPRHPAPGTVRIFPPLGSCAA
jgi:hypothetical protein